MKDIFCLTFDERGELARRFKYYHSSVRPGDKFNLVETLNGTFFNLNTEIEMLQTRVSDGSVDLELIIVIHYLDDRLIMRELTDVLTIPNEFTPWIPNIETSPSLDLQKSVHVDPKTGQITVFLRVNSKIQCYSEIWKHPFDSFQCELFFSTEQDERIFLRALRDLRPDNQINSVSYRAEEWPHMMLFLSFNSQWHSSIVNIYLPTILILSLFIFAQWKRRKIQIIIGVSSLISIIILQTSQRRHEQITLQDLWMSGILLHLIAILTVDLVLPARRIVHTTISNINEPVKTKILTIQDSPVSRKINRYSSEQFPLLGHSPKEERTRRDSGRQVYGYIGPAATETTVPLARNDTDSDALTDVYVFRHSLTPQNVKTPPIHRQITQTTIGHKKRIALGVILIFYAIFILAYTIMVFYVLNIK
uniref:Neurotransmitter-gated ion-channel ligand-binding domain-containing protein n=1 Tax=Panagrolaimus sp. JU765 TaxID=591449 RepID=A0AC34REU0_9BILA